MYKIEAIEAIEKRLKNQKALKVLIKRLEQYTLLSGPFVYL